MPQLDFATFFSQIFWLFFIFFSFYFLFFKSLVPIFSLILKTRFKKLKRTTRLVSVIGDQNWYFKADFDKTLSQSLVGVNSFLVSYVKYAFDNREIITQQLVKTTVLPVFVTQLCKSFSSLGKVK